MNNFARNPRNSSDLSRMTYRGCENSIPVHIAFRGTIVPKYTSRPIIIDSGDAVIPTSYKGKIRDKRDFW